MSLPIKLYVDLMSPPVRLIYIFLKLTKIPFETVSVAFRKGEHLQESFKEVNRFQKLPCIDDNGFRLSESIAILRYLEHLNNGEDYWYPKNLKDRALVDEYLEWQHNNTRLNVSQYFFGKWRKPLMTGQPPDPKIIKELQLKLDNTLDQIETIWLKNTRYIASDQVSIADIFAACEIEQTRLCDYDPVRNRPNTEQWMNLVKIHIMTKLITF